MAAMLALKFPCSWRVIFLMMKQILIRVRSRYTQQPPPPPFLCSFNTMTGNSYEDLWVCFKPPHLPASVQAQTFLSEAHPAILSLSLEDSVQPGEGSRLGVTKTSWIIWCKPKQLPSWASKCLRKTFLSLQQGGKVLACRITVTVTWQN